jgi:crotonobetainyl-CoA:carnitine CoA-transferase CaiB-like acyl-CoA transferase
MTSSGYPLAGLRVLDLSRILAGPVCTQLLADLGADVVKIERPGAGDDTRQWGPPFLTPGESGYFLSCNRGKRSLALDLYHAEGRAVLDGLLQQADVMIENFLPDSLARLGLEPERLAELNPNLVSCSISAFGRTGPLADTPGYDLMIQAGSGLMAITGEPNGRPMKVGVAISDVISGLYAATSLLAGVYARQQGKPGVQFDLALADCTLASLVNVAQGALLTGKRPKRFGNAHPQIVPYEVFATADGYLALAIGADRQWQRFCAGVEREDWAADARFATNPARVEHRDELISQMNVLLREHTTRAWQDLLESIDVPHSPVLAVDEALNTPQAAARGMVQEITDSSGQRYKLLGSAVHWHNQPVPEILAPPRVGEHTDAVLRDWLGFDDQQIEALRTAAAVA